MPIVQVSHAPNRELYEAVAQRLDLDTNRPEGLVLHAASETASGEIEIIDVYDTVQQLEAFARDRLFPAFGAAGVMPMIEGNEPPTPYEPFDYVI
jgi:hypothetical protein